MSSVFDVPRGASGHRLRLPPIEGGRMLRKGRYRANIGAVRRVVPQSPPNAFALAHLTPRLGTNTNGPNSFPGRSSFGWAVVGSASAGKNVIGKQALAL